MGSSNTNIHGIVHREFSDDEPDGAVEQVKGSKGKAPQTQVSGGTHPVVNVGAGKSTQSAQSKAELSNSMIHPDHILILKGVDNTHTSHQDI